MYYASRKLTPVEQRYSQFEREALGIKWACEKFYLFLCGTEFEICTDHKPLLTVLGPKGKPPSARVERWLLYLQQFRYNLTHIPDKLNHVDVLSRLPCSDTSGKGQELTEHYAYSVVRDAVPVALSPRMIERASVEDPELQMLMKCIRTGD